MAHAETRGVYEFKSQWLSACHRKIALRVTVRDDSGVAGEGRAVGVPKFHSWGKYTMPLTNISTDRMSNASSGLCIIYIILRGSFKLHLGV